MSRYVFTSLGVVLLLHSSLAAQITSTVFGRTSVISGTEHITVGPGMDASGLRLWRANLQFVDLTGSDFRDAILADTQFQSSNLTGADFRNAEMSNPSFFEANLTDADIRGAVIDRLTLEQFVSTASYKTRDLSGVRFRIRFALPNLDLTGQNLTNAAFGSTTVATATFADALIEGSSLPEVTFDQLWSTASFQNRSLRGVRFWRTDFSHQVMDGFNAAGANFSSLPMQGSSWRNADLSGAVFSSVSLEDELATGVSFRDANLTGADLSGLATEHVDFEGAEIANAKFAGGGFRVAHIVDTQSFMDRRLPGITIDAAMPDADFSGIDLTAATLSGSMQNAIFRDADLTSARISPARVDSPVDFSATNLTGATLRVGNLPVVMPAARFDDATISHASVPLSNEQLYSTASYRAQSLVGWDSTGSEMVDVDLSNQDLTDSIHIEIASANLTNADLTGVTLNGTAFDRVQFESTRNYAEQRFQRADLEWLDLRGADLRRIDFSGTNVRRWSNFTDAILDGANLTDVRLGTADILGASLSGATITRTDLGNTNISVEQLQSTASWALKSMPGIILSDRQLEGVDLTGVDLTNAMLVRTDLRHSSLLNANLADVDLSEGKLDGADFSGAAIDGTDFSKSNVSFDQLSRTTSFVASNLDGIGLESVHLPEANFSGQSLRNANLRAAHLVDANLQGADLSNAEIYLANFSGARLAGDQIEVTADVVAGVLAEVKFDRVDLSGVNLADKVVRNVSFVDGILVDAEFSNASLENSTFQRADLTGANFEAASMGNSDFHDATINGARLGMAFTREVFETTASFRTADLSGVQFGPRHEGWNLSRQNLLNAKFEHSSLLETDFTEADLTGASFAGADIRQAVFSGTNLTYQQLAETDSYHRKKLTQVSLGGIDLRNANFTDADLRGTDFTGTNLADASFSNADVLGVSFRDTTAHGFVRQQFYETRQYENRGLFRVDLSMNDLSGWDFANQNLVGSNFAESNLEGADFRGARITESSFEDAIGFSVDQLLSTESYQDGKLQGMKFRGQNFDAVDFRGMSLVGSQVHTTSLRGANFGGANLTGVDFTGSQLQGTNLAGAQLADAVFRDANLSNVNLSGSELSSLDLTNAILQGANFTSVRLENVTLGPQLQRQDFSDATFVDVTLDDAQLPDTNFQNAHFSATTLSRADLTGVNFDGVSWESISLDDSNVTVAQLRATMNYQEEVKAFFGIDVSRVDLEGLDLSGANLSGSTFAGSNLAGVSFDGAFWIDPLDMTDAVNLSPSLLRTTRNYTEGRLTNLSLRGVDLANSEWVDVEFDNVDFSGANLSNARFTNTTATSNVQFVDANLTGATIEGPALEQANFSGADVSQATLRSLSSSQLQSTKSFMDGDFRGVTLEGSLPRPNMNYRGFDFTGARLAVVQGFMDFEAVKFVDTVFEGSSFDRVSFEGSDFTRANLGGAYFLRSDFSGAILTDAILQDMEYPTGLTDEQFESTASFKAKTLRGLRFGVVTFSETDFAGFDMTGSTFTNTKLFDVDFSGANLAMAEIQPWPGSTVDFSGANLANSTIRIGHFFNGPENRDPFTLSFANANLVGATVEVRSGSVNQTIDYENADITSASIGYISGPELASTRTFREGNLRTVTLNGGLDNIDLGGQDLSELDWHNVTLGENVDLTDTNFSRARLPIMPGELFSQTATWKKRDFEGLQFSGRLVDYDFRGLNLAGASFSVTRIEDSDFTDATVNGVDFQHVHSITPLLTTASHRNRDFSDINFDAATTVFGDVTDFDFTDSTFEGSRVSDSDFRGATGLVLGESARVVESILPDGTLRLDPTLFTRFTVAVKNHEVPVKLTGRNVTLDLQLDNDPWLAPVVVVEDHPLPLNLRLTITEDASQLELIGDELHIVDWQEISNARASVAFDSFQSWDTSRLHTEGIVTYLGDRRVDVDGNGEVEVRDVQRFCRSVRLGRYDRAIDLDFNGELNAADVELFRELSGLLAGDFDLDGTVGFNDFLTLSGAFDDPRNWTGGNVDCTGDVDFADFLALSENFNATAIYPYDFAGTATAAVPEPAGGRQLGLVLALVTLGLSRIRPGRGGRVEHA